MIEPGVIYNGNCNFCKEDKEIMHFNFQAICEACAIKHFLPILIKFKVVEVLDAAKTTAKG